MLRAEAVELRRLLGHLGDEHAALIAGDPGRVVTLLAARDAILARLDTLETARAAALAAIAAELAVDPGALTLTRLCALVPAARERLEGLRAELRAELDALATTARRNQFVAERATAYAERMLGVLLSSVGVAPAPTYGRSGRAAVGPSPLQLVDRAV